MKQHISELLHFVRIKGPDQSETWWPALCSTSFTSIVSLIENTKTQAHCTLIRSKCKKDSKTSWVLLFGKVRPTKKVFFPLSPREFESNVKGYFLHSESMELKYKNNIGWQVAMGEALSMLEKEMSMHDTTTIDCPDGSFTIFQEAGDDSAYLLQQDSAIVQGRRSSSQDTRIDNERSNHLDVKPSASVCDKNTEDYEMNCDNSDGGEDIVHDTVKVEPKKENSSTVTKSKKSKLKLTRGKKRKQSSSSSSSYDEKSKKKVKSSSSATVEEQEEDDNGTRSSPRLNKTLSSSSSSKNKSDKLKGKDKRDRRREEMKKEHKTKIRKVSNDESIDQRRRSPRMNKSGESEDLNFDQAVSKKGKVKSTDKEKYQDSRKVSIRRSPRRGSDAGLNNDNPQSFATQQQKNTPSSPSVTIRTSPRLRNSPHASKRVTPQKHDPKKQSNGMLKSLHFIKKKKRIIGGRVPWTEVMNILHIDYGIYHVRGSGLVSEYYVYNVYQENGDKVTEEIIQKSLKHKEDYFINEDGLKAWAYKSFKWIGEPGREFTPIKEGRRSRKEPKESKPEEKKAIQKEPTKSKSASSTASKANDSKQEDKNVGQKKSTKSKSKTSTSEKNDKEQNQKLVQLPVKERLAQSTKSLNECNNTKDTFYDGSGPDSSFAQNKTKILDFLENSTSLKSNGLMYVCGNPGQGKTTLVKDCVDIVASSNKKISILELTASTLGEDKIAKTLTTHIAKAIGKPHNTSIDTIDKHLMKNSRSHLIMILDEIQFLMKHKSMDPTLIRILSWASNKTYGLSVIGISNSVGDKDARLLHSKAKVQCELVFKPYTEADLKGIALKRLGPNQDLIEMRAIDLACKKVAKNNGDARSLLDVLKRAFVKCQESLSVEEQSSTDISGPLVKITHVSSSFQKDVNEKHTAIIKKLPQRVKIILCVATALDQVCEKTKSISVEELKYFSFMASRHGMIDDLSSDSFRSMVEQLVDAGLLTRSDPFDFGSGDEQDYMGDERIRVGAQLEEVEHVIKESLLQNDFYKRIVNEVKKIRPCL